MKSLIEEASSIIKAIEKAWEQAGKPQSFSVKIFEEPESNFLGFNKKPAKVGIFFEETLKETLRSNNHQRSYNKEADHRNGAHTENREARPSRSNFSGPRPRRDDRPAREERTHREERPLRDERRNNDERPSREEHGQEVRRNEERPFNKNNRSRYNKRAPFERDERGPRRTEGHKEHGDDSQRAPRERHENRATETTRTETSVASAPDQAPLRKPTAGTPGSQRKTLKVSNRNFVASAKKDTDKAE